MISFKKSFVIAITVTLLLNSQKSEALIEDAIDIFRLAKEVVGGISETWNIVEQTDAAKNVELPFIKRREENILKKMTELSNQIQESETYMMNAANMIIERINEQVADASRLDTILHELSNYINQISVKDVVMKKYSHNYKILERMTLEEFAKWIVSPAENSIQGVLERIHLLVTGSSDFQPFSRAGLLELIEEHMEQAKSTICTFGLSAQQVLYQLYNAISITELKGYSMMQFSWMLLRTYGKGNFTTEADLMRERFEIRMNKTQSILQRVMERSDREVWRCDPQSSKHQNGETYLEITRLLQGYVENEVNMNTEETCKENCAYYNGVQQETCYKDLYCAQQKKCSGKIYDCQYVDSDMWICPASEGSSRRYEYIEYESGKVLGNKKYCPRGTTKVDSWWRWVFWHCSYCFCLCDDAGPKSDRYFNMRETVSDISENKVVTGVRFIKKNRIIHLQIQQGKLLPRGNIENTTLTWVEPSSYKILDANIRNNFDYYTLSWDNRAIDLDDLMAPPSYVVTGVRFRKIGSHLNLEIRITEIDFGTGELIDPTVINWVSSDYTENSDPKRTEVVMDHPDIPTKTHTNSIPISVSNQFIKFRASDFSKDASQTTIPFIDAQPCVSAKPSPLAGVGLFYKGANKFGGFITPKAFTYDLGPHIQKPTIPQGTEYYEVV